MTDEPPHDRDGSPALSDAELRETFDLMATAVASMSDRIDDLTRVADKQIKVSTEAWIAAFAAREQTDPKKYGELVGITVSSHLTKPLETLLRTSDLLNRQSEQTAGILKKAEEDHTSKSRALWDREQTHQQDVEKFRSRKP